MKKNFVKSAGALFLAAGMTVAPVQAANENAGLAENFRQRAYWDWQHVLSLFDEYMATPEVAEYIPEKAGEDQCITVTNNASIGTSLGPSGPAQIDVDIYFFEEALKARDALGDGGRFHDTGSHYDTVQAYKRAHPELEDDTILDQFRKTGTIDIGCFKTAQEAVAVRMPLNWYLLRQYDAKAAHYIESAAEEIRQNGPLPE